MLIELVFMIDFDGDDDIYIDDKGYYFDFDVLLLVLILEINYECY